MPTLTKIELKVADEVWIVTALLHMENPSSQDFTIEQITDRARKELAAGKLRPGFYVHVIQHCVANRPPNPGRYRMLTEPRIGYRRLYRPSDAFHPGRTGSKTTPARDELPEKYRALIDWYESLFVDATSRNDSDDPILAMRGLGKEIWEGVDPDEYVRELREGWE